MPASNRGWVQEGRREHAMATRDKATTPPTIGVSKPIKSSVLAVRKIRPVANAPSAVCGSSK